MKKFSSTNGRWGVQVDCPDDQKFPARGSFKPLGRLGGFDCFAFQPDEEGSTFAVIEGDAKALKGCVVVMEMGLQSNDYITLLHAHPGAIWKTSGYKGRSHSFWTLTEEGNQVKVPEAALLSLGLIEPEEAPHALPEIPDDVPERSTVLLALQKAGLA